LNYFARIILDYTKRGNKLMLLILIQSKNIQIGERDYFISKNYRKCESDVNEIF
jgi:hypothetical protein